MKYLIVSDIHGSYHYGKLAIEAYEKHACDKIILLGDILYHGPRNDLPLEYNPKALLTLLNEYKDKIIAVKGNCDAAIDQTVLHFPILAPYFLIQVKNKLVVFTHGDIFNSDNLPMEDIVLVCGHIHVQRKDIYPNHVYLNPGSISCPKEDSYHGYMVLDDTTFYYYDENDQLRDSYSIQ